MKSKVPVFDGRDPEGWLSQIEGLFDSYSAPEEWRLRLISYHMEGEADDWLLYSLANNQLTTWPEFRFRFQQQFGFSVYDSVFKRLMKNVEDRIQSLENKSSPEIISLPSLQTDIQPLISTPLLDQSPPPPAADAPFISTPTSVLAPSLQENEESEVQYQVPSSPTSLLPPLFLSGPAFLTINMPQTDVLPKPPKCPQPISSTTTAIDTFLPVYGHAEDQGFEHFPRYLKKNIDAEILVAPSAWKLFDQLIERVVCSPKKEFLFEKIKEESIWSFDPGGGLISIKACTRTKINLFVFGLEYVLGKIPPNYFLILVIMCYNVLLTWRTSIFHIRFLMIMVEHLKCLHLLKGKNLLIQDIRPTNADESVIHYTCSSYAINSKVKVAYLKVTCAKNCDYLQTLHANYFLCVGYSLEMVKMVELYITTPLLCQLGNYRACIVLDMEALHINCCEFGARFGNLNNGDVELLNGARHGKFQESGCAEYFDCTQRTEVYFSLVGGNIAERDVVVELSDRDIVQVRGCPLFHGAYDKSSLDEQFAHGVNLAMAPESCLVFDPGEDIPAMSSYKKVIYGEEVELHGAGTKDDMSLELWPLWNF